jgi:hypothetical protein
MSNSHKWRGHEIYEREGEWYYADDNTPVADEPNPICGHCDRANSEKGHDWCIRDLCGVQNACCGHGEPDKAYAVLTNSKRITGQAVFELRDIQDCYSPLGKWIINRGKLAVVLIYPIIGTVEAVGEALIVFCDRMVWWRCNLRGALVDAGRLKQIKKVKK